MNVLLVGEEAAGIQTLKVLMRSSHHIVAVMASDAKTALGAGNLWNVAQKLGCPTWPGKLVKDPALADRIRAEDVDILLNVHSLFIINGKVVEAPRYGSYNMHPGPLPRYAGLNAPSWAIYRDEKTHGVTVHRMLAGIDTGPIAFQAMVDITETDTGLTLSSKCVKAGLPLVYALLDKATTDPGSIPHIEQDLSKREYFTREVPQQGIISWDRPARAVYNFVRASDYLPFKSPWGIPKTEAGGREIAVVQTALTGELCRERPGTIGDRRHRGIQVACANEWILVTLVQVDGKFMDPAEAFKPGDRLGSWNGDPAALSQE